MKVLLGDGVKSPKRRKTLTISKELLDEISEFRWRNRFESYSQAVEFILKQGISTLALRNFHIERGNVAEERKLNNEFYRKVKPKLLEEHMNEYVVIAHGRLLGFAQRFEEALKILGAHIEKANHAIIDKIGEEVKVSEVWEGFVEKIK
jgi:hypothetical protein